MGPTVQSQVALTSSAHDLGATATICQRLADVAQLVEHFTRNEGVPGSSPGVGFG
jgi:hypothetical protein